MGLARSIERLNGIWVRIKPERRVLVKSFAWCLLFFASYLQAQNYTVTADLAGIPGISVPCGETKEKLPIGLQILGKHFDEATILRIAHAYEQAA